MIIKDGNMEHQKILITYTGCYYRHYVNVGDVVAVDGYTVHGHPYILSKSKRNAGHKIVFVIGTNCELVP